MCNYVGYAPTVSKLQLSAELRGSDPVLLVAGEADITSAGELRELLVSRTWMLGRRLTIDASELSFIDSWAAQVLVVTAKTLRDRGGELVLLHLQEPVARVLALLGADEVITVVGWPGK